MEVTAPFRVRAPSRVPPAHEPMPGSPLPDARDEPDDRFWLRVRQAFDGPETNLSFPSGRFLIESRGYEEKRLEKVVR